ncbi:MAG: hypothetical protein ACXV8Q_04710 [Methylobacter sp.]
MQKIKIAFQSPLFCPLFHFAAATGIDNTSDTYYSLQPLIQSTPENAPQWGVFLFVENNSVSKDRLIFLIQPLILVNTF